MHANTLPILYIVASVNTVRLGNALQKTTISGEYLGYGYT